MCIVYGMGAGKGKNRRVRTATVIRHSSNHASCKQVLDRILVAQDTLSSEQREVLEKMRALNYENWGWIIENPKNTWVGTKEDWLAWGRRISKYSRSLDLDGTLVFDIRQTEPLDDNQANISQKTYRSRLKCAQTCLNYLQKLADSLESKIIVVPNANQYKLPRPPALDDKKKYFWEGESLHSLFIANTSVVGLAVPGLGVAIREHGGLGYKDVLKEEVMARNIAHELGHLLYQHSEHTHELARKGVINRKDKKFFDSKYHCQHEIEVELFSMFLLEKFGVQGNYLSDAFLKSYLDEFGSKLFMKQFNPAYDLACKKVQEVSKDLL